jgi:hypothetical protein
MEVPMEAKKLLALAIVGLACLSAPVAPVLQTQEKPVIEIPKPGVPQIMTIEGTFVRAAYNNEGYVIIGYELANRSVGEPWMLLEVGMTLRDGVREQTLKRDALSLETPDGKTIPLPSVSEHRAANTTALQNREKVQRESINYFPPGATRACRIGFFSELSSPAMAYDEVSLSNTRACLGRLFFPVAGGIKHGQHWLNVKLEKSVLRVPFRILTAEEEKLLDKNYKDIRKQVQDAFRKK